jgi:hypothetical protein
LRHGGESPEVVVARHSREKRRFQQSRTECADRGRASKIFDYTLRVEIILNIGVRR